ncbi:hypothetical protein C6366_10815 [Desulfonatronum sp. SC1]|nr:hypothetical protein C6366_10815 [Desulfonatronum sp. SC1]
MAMVARQSTYKEAAMKASVPAGCKDFTTLRLFRWTARDRNDADPRVYGGRKGIGVNKAAGCA